ncbi:sensor histidine kinase [Sporosarcina sp. USHLN248]|uniref:sensor histidine kinase n=1 Tax=Sporosarcina sp. USHLN248 TaxID=3081300 RepID=UPI00301785A1
MSVSFRQYIRFQKRLFVLYIAIMSFITIMLYVEPTMSVHFSNLVYIHTIALFFFISFLTIDFYLVSKQYKAFSSRWSKGTFIRDGIDDPKTYEQHLYWELFQSVNDAHQQQLTSILHDKKESMEFMTTWFHDIKTPIAISKLILEQAKENPDSESISEEISRIERSVDQALYFTRTDHFARDYIIRKTGLDAVIRSVVKQFAKEFIRRRIKIVIQMEPLCVETDSKWLAYSLSEFLSNALKYSNDGGTITIYSEEDLEESRVVILDEGVGIPQHDISRVFQLGFTGANGRINRKSTGIGLYIAKKIMDKIGHNVTISSTEGVSTAVTIHFRKNDYYSTIM